MGKREDFSYCRAVIRKNSKSFYFAFSRLPPLKADALFAVYAFCRFADDLIDVHHDCGGLERLHGELVQFSHGDTPEGPMWRALRIVFSSFQMDIAPFFAMLEGQKRDVNFTQPLTEAELQQYCYLVAGTVGEMVLPILASRNAGLLRDDAIALGVAMQITNILRDVGEDLDHGRVYLPADVMGEHGYALDDLKSKIVDSRFIAVWEHLAVRAEELYGRAQRTFHLYDHDCIMPLLIATTLYQEILAAVRQSNYNCLNERSYVGTLRKAAVLGQACCQAKKLKRKGVEL